MAALTINSARIPSGETPVQGVPLEPYVLVRRADNSSCNAEEVPEEGSGDARFSLRFRWYRSVVNRGGAVCFFHQVRGGRLCQLAQREVGGTCECALGGSQRSEFQSWRPMAGQGRAG